MSPHAFAVSLVLLASCGLAETPDRSAPHEAAAATAEGSGSLPATSPSPAGYGVPQPQRVGLPPLHIERCGPTAGGPYWIEEGQTLEVRVRCRTGYSGTRLTIENPPAGAVVDARTQTLRWTPRLNQAGVYLLSLYAPDLDERGTVKVGVADAFDAPGNTRIQSAEGYSEEFGVPVLHLTAPSVSQVYQPATVLYRGHSFRIEVKYRGATSLDFPKRSFTLKFSKNDLFSEPERGFMNRRSLALVTTFNDNSCLRSRLAFELWNRMSAHNLPVAAFSVVVVLNGRYQGLYTVVDHVNDDYLEAQGLNEDGNLFKAVADEANFSLVDSSGLPKPSLHTGFEKKEGAPPAGQPGAFADLDALVKWVATATDSDFAAGVGTTLDAEDYENWWMLTAAILATDSYAKNAYHFHDPKGGPWRFVPWDLDASFGQNWDTTRAAASWVPHFEGGNLLYARLIAVPTLGAAMRARFRALLHGAWSEARVLGLIDDLEKELRPCALRDERRWGAEYRSFPRWSVRTDLLSHDDEVRYVRQWVHEHWRAIDGAY